MQSQSQQQGVNFWKPAAIGSILLALVQLYEPAKDIYSVWYVPGAKDAEDLRIGEWQNRLAIRNQSCVVDMPRTKVAVNDHLDMMYGICPNDNVLVVIYPKDKSAFQLWMEPNEKLTANAQLGGLMSSAYAAMAGSPSLAPQDIDSNAPIRAQTMVKTVCQGWNNAQRTKIDRITNEGAQCYYERVNTLSGIIEVREVVTCDTNCDAAGKQFNSVKR
jgi:hypothetical protein